MHSLGIRDQGKPGEPGHRNIGRGSCRSALADGVERTPVNSSGTRLTLALGGGLEGPHPPGNHAVPVPIRLLSRRRKASGERVGEMLILDDLFYKTTRDGV